MRRMYRRIGRDRGDEILNDGIGCNGKNAGIEFRGWRLNVGVAGNKVEYLRGDGRGFVVMFERPTNGMVSVHVQWWAKADVF